MQLYLHHQGEEDQDAHGDGGRGQCRANQPLLHLQPEQPREQQQLSSPPPQRKNNDDNGTTTGGAANVEVGKAGDTVAVEAAEGSARGGCNSCGIVSFQHNLIITLFTLCVTPTR
jgi:hypothetical protein